VLIPNDSNEYHDLHAEACIERIRSLAALNDISTRITDSLPVLLKKNSINPIKSWIFSKVWDGVSRVNQLANHLIVSPNERALATKIFRAWMVQCIAALDKAEIGCKLNPIAVPKYELILILQGIQGVLKTTFFSSLLPGDISPIYIKTSSHLDIKSRDSVKQNVSCWINELGEFDSTTKKNEISMIKAFTSAQSDVMRLAFGRKDLTLKRGVSFCGTVNDERFLGDTTGSRRFGVIRIIDIARNEMDMQQLWAEVWGLYASGEKWWLDKVDESEMQTHNQKYHQLINPIEDALESKYDFTILGTNRMTATQIYRECFVDKVPTQKDLNTLAAYLVKKGIVKVMGKGVTIYKMP
jgi:putative DNA primase/helicase